VPRPPRVASHDARRAAEARADELEEALAESQRRLGDERQQQSHASSSGEQARREAMHARAEVDNLHRQLADREVLLAGLRAEANQAAVAAAAQLDALRARVQELRNERDTLARASQLLLEERDAAAALGRQVLDADARAKDLAELLAHREQQLAQREHDVARLESERAAAEHARAAFEATLRDVAEDARRTELEAEQLRGRLTSAERDAGQARERLQQLDIQLAEQRAALKGGRVWTRTPPVGSPSSRSCCAKPPSRCASRSVTPRLARSRGALGPLAGRGREPGGRCAVGARSRRGAGGRGHRGPDRSDGRARSCQGRPGDERRAAGGRRGGVATRAR
jgi:hypothetical protein